MKISNDLLRSLIRECMQDMGMGVSNFAPAVEPAKPQMMGGAAPDPDGYEGRMAKSNLFKMAEYSMQLHNMIQDEQNLEPWVQEKIAVAASMMDSVAHYMQYEKVRGPQQQQAMPVQVTTIGE